MNDLLGQLNALLLTDDDDINICDHICDTCNKLLEPSDNNRYICTDCGFLKKVSNNEGYSDVVKNNHNISPNSSNSLKMEGSNYFDNSRFRNVNADQGMLRKKTIMEDFRKYNTKSEFKFPQNIITEATEYAFSILSNECFRNNPRRGIYAACVKAACVRASQNGEGLGISRKDIEYSSFTNTDPKYLAFGESVVKNKLKIDLSAEEQSDDQKTSFVKRYTESLQLGNYFNGLIIELIEVVEDSNRLAGKNKETIWAGSMCYIFEKIDKNHKKNIGAVTNITSSTFNKFKREIEAYNEEFGEIINKINDVVEKYQK